MEFKRKNDRYDKDIQLFVKATYERSYDKIHMIARRHSKRYYDDLIQDAFHNFQNALRNNPDLIFENDESVIGWFSKTIHNLAINQGRKSNRIINTNEFKEIEETENPWIKLDLNYDFTSELKQCNPDYVEFLRMKIKGYSYLEIAKFMGKKPETIRKGLFRIRKHFKDIWR